jgi:diaminopimelate epimerase
MKFWKYQGAGNDFIMVDQRQKQWLTRADTETIERLCDRRFGIGADGLILLQNSAGYDFEMVYFNADGRESSMCGNGGRCIAAFALHRGIISGHGRFMAIDGEHEAKMIRSIAPKGEWVELKMIEVHNIEQDGNTFVLNTGSPHYVRFETRIDDKNMVQEGRAVRYSERFSANGINVNLVSLEDEGLNIRTYERGVEDETLACGTGVTAAAIASALYRNQNGTDAEVAVQAAGGNLSVRFKRQPDGVFTDIWLCGPAQQVFEGEIDI